MNQPIVLIVVGIVVGIYSGLMGVGGGTVMIPIMVLLLGFTQHQAVATSLTVMTVPVFLLGVIDYYRKGFVDLRVALLVAVGVLPGVWLGAQFAQRLSDRELKLLFGFVLVYVAGYTIFQTLGKEQFVRNMGLSAALLALAVAIYMAMVWYDRRAGGPGPGPAVEARRAEQEKQR